MKKLIKLMALIALITLAAGMTVYAKGSPKKIKVTVNESTVKYNGSPYIRNGEVMIPVRQTVDALGGDTEWNKKDKTAWIHLGMMHVELIVGKNEIYIHRDADFSGIPQTVKLNTPVTYTRGKVYIPAKTVLESLGLVVTWNKTKNTLAITSDGLPITVAYDEIIFDDIKNNSKLANWYNENSKKLGINYMKDGNYLYALIGGGERPTGGFLVAIDQIYYSTSDTVTIQAKVTPPGDNVRVMMVITYPNMLIRINSKQVTKVVGDVVDVSTKEKWMTMDDMTVTKAELYNIEQVKLRDLTQLEKDTTIKAFNEATIDQNAYIEMITGNLLRVSLSDGYVVTFTSYGSQTNVIANFAKDGDNRSFHLVAPEIAKLLLQK